MPRYTAKWEWRRWEQHRYHDQHGSEWLAITCGLNQIALTSPWMTADEKLALLRLAGPCGTHELG